MDRKRMFDLIALEDLKEDAREKTNAAKTKTLQGGTAHLNARFGQMEMPCTAEEKEQSKLDKKGHPEGDEGAEGGDEGHGHGPELPPSVPRGGKGVREHDSVPRVGSLAPFAAMERDRMGP